MVLAKGGGSHTFQSKFAVFPGDNYEEHLNIVTGGGLNLTGKKQKNPHLS